MVAVVSVLQLLQHLFIGQTELVGKTVDMPGHLRAHLLLRYATDGGVWLLHADVGNVVQFAEDAELGEFRYACEEHKAQIGVATLQRGIEVAHHVAKDGKVLFLVHHVEKRSVIFVYQDHDLLPGLLVGTNDERCQPVVRINSRIRYPILRLIAGQSVGQVALQAVLVKMLAKAHIEMQHRIRLPFRLKAVYGKSRKQLLAPLEIAFQRGCQQRLAEPSRTAQEKVFCRTVCKIVNIHRLVHIQIIFLYYIREGLYAHRASFKLLRLFHKTF